MRWRIICSNANIDLEDASIPGENSFVTPRLVFMINIAL